ncbi:MAG: hypothetical protein MI920_32165 [Kiloniellales bacterium]|nr:hypothetical protein [Kiloniellales bacterium]
MEDTAWPFLVSRSRLRGYQTVVSPDFLIGVEAAALLCAKVEETPFDGTSVSARCTQLADSPAGPLTMIYRAEKARLNGEILKDDAGRPVMKFSGLVLRGLHDPEDLGEDAIAIAQAKVEEGFLRFWNQGGGTAPEPAAGFSIASSSWTDVVAPPPIRHVRPPAGTGHAPLAQDTDRHPHPAIVASVLIAVVFIGVSVAALLLSTPEPASEPTSQPAMQEQTNQEPAAAAPTEADEPAEPQPQEQPAD